MTASDQSWRSTLARELTIRARMSATEALGRPVKLGGGALRTGITGPPGAGKSSLIAALAKHWLAEGSKVGVLAVDPTSPVSGGSLLGDRVRMEEVASHDDAFIRSVPSGSSSDGLCPNILSLLEAFDDAGFDETILETVGVGQVSYEARMLVDTFVLVLIPESGDTVQAMKAGILETADIYVVNKSDLDGAKRLETELRSVTKWRARSSDWAPPVIMVSALEETGIDRLAQAVALHRQKMLTDDRREALNRARRDYLVKSLLTRDLAERLDRGGIAEGSSGTILPNDLISKLALLAPRAQ